MSTTALMKFTNDLFTSFDKGQLTGAIFIDLSEVFDMVDHLPDKLHVVGFDQNSLLWFNSYLHNRRQYVVFFFKPQIQIIWLLITVFLKAQHWIFCSSVPLLMTFPKLVHALSFIFMQITLLFTLPTLIHSILSAVRF